MATLNISIPDEVKRAFREAFAGENRSAVVTRLICEAVEEKRRQGRRAAAIDALLDLRRRQAPADSSEIVKARRKGRP